MRTRTLGKAMLLLFAAGLPAFPSGRSECSAQTGADPERERLSLSAAIAEARRSPFHAGARGAGVWNEPSKDMGTVGAAASYPTQSGPQDQHPMNGFSFATTIVLAELSHLTAAVLFWGCGFGEFPPVACFLGPILPLPVVALPAAASGVDLGRALGASGIGLLGGAAAYLVTGYITEQISNIRIFSSALVSGLVHAVITPALLRPR